MIKQIFNFLILTTSLFIFSLYPQQTISQGENYFILITSMEKNPQQVMQIVHDVMPFNYYKEYLTDQKCIELFAIFPFSQCNASTIIAKLKKAGATVKCVIKKYKIIN